MVTDYKKQPGNRKGRPRGKDYRQRNAFFAGALTGCLLSLLVFYFDPISRWVGSQREASEESRAQLPDNQASTSRPKFEFYSILPEMEIPVGNPDDPAGDKSAVSGEPPSATPVNSPGRYILQAGSFRSVADADRLKATLVLLGSDASIVPVNVNGEVWHRVRIGPYTDLGQLNDIRSRLAESNIQVMLLRLRE